MSNITSFITENSTCLSEFKKYHLTKDDIEGKPFEYITSYIGRGIVLKNTKKFLEAIKSYLHQNKEIVKPRIFLSSYVVVYFKDIVLDVETDNDIYESSARLLKNLNIFLETTTDENLFTFKNSLFQYYGIFKVWKQRDRNRLIENLSKDYWDFTLELKNNIDKYEDQKKREILTICIEREQQQIIQKVYDLGGEEAMDYFNRLIPVSVHTDVYNKFDEIIKQIFWNDFEIELNKNPPNYLSIIPMLEDVKKYIKNCVPNNISFHKEIDENIDIPFVKQMIEHNAIDDMYIHQMVNYILSVIKNLESPYLDSETNKWIHEVNKKLKSNVKYSEFFPMFFKDVFMNLELIIEETERYRILLSNNEDDTLVV